MRICLPVLLLLPAGAWGSNLTFEFTNPSFGGNPLNGSFLLNSAQAQNDLGDKNDPFTRDPLASFEESLVRQSLSAMARKIVNDLFNSEEGLGDGGVYNTDQFQIEVITTDPDVVLVSITDFQTNQTTVIEIPRF